MTRRIRQQQYAVYKGLGGKFGAIQFNFQPPHYYKNKGRDKDFDGSQAVDSTGKVRYSEGWQAREGAVFIDAASTIGKNEYDWNNKITFACSIDDMGKIVHALTTNTDPKIMHDPGAKSDKAGMVTKTLSIYTKGSAVVDGCMITITEKEGDNRKEHKIPLTGAEVIVVRQLMLAAVPAALNW